MDYVLAGYVEKLADSCIQLSQNDKDFVAVTKDINEVLQILTKRIRALEEKPVVKCDIFVTTTDGYTFPVQQFDNVRDAYYWILGAFILGPYATSLLYRFNIVNFEKPQKYRSYEVVKVVIR